MFALGHTLWIILTLYIDSLLPLGCKAITTQTTEIWMEDEDDSDARFASRLGRRLLGSGDTSSGETIFYIFVAIFFLLMMLIIKCCQKFASDQEDEIKQRVECPPITYPPPAYPPPAYPPPAYPPPAYPPPAYPRDRHSERLPSGSRPLAPPMTSRSIILFPEESHFEPFFTAMQSPAVHTSSTSIGPERRNSNPTPILDLPPDYDSAVKEDAEICAINASKDAEDRPPKYGYS